MLMSSEQRPWVFITRDKFFTTLPIMVFGQTSIGDSELDASIFPIGCPSLFIFPGSLYFHLPLLAKPSTGAGDMSGNASCQANSTLIIEWFF